MNLLFLLMFVISITAWYSTREGDFWTMALGWVPIIIWVIWLNAKIEAKKEEK